eukprot:1137439-Pelagomonas_calceolata.AAC.2
MGLRYTRWNKEGACTAHRGRQRCPCTALHAEAYCIYSMQTWSRVLPITLQIPIRIFYLESFLCPRSFSYLFFPCKQDAACTAREEAPKTHAAAHLCACKLDTACTAGRGAPKMYAAAHLCVCRVASTQAGNASNQDARSDAQHRNHHFMPSQT